MALARHSSQFKDPVAHRRVSLAEEFGLHAAVLLIALAAVVARVAG